jgi:DNA primase
MITLDGVVILTEISTIVLDLKSELQVNGINLLHNVKAKDTAKDVMISCPVHNAGQERNASCGISKVDKIRNGKNYPAGTVHCFTCGYTADFFEFVAYILGQGNNRNYGRRYVIQKYNTMEIAQRPDVKLNCERRTPGSLPYGYTDESILDNYRYTSDYLYARQFELPTILFYEYGYNPQNDTITMPVRDHRGGLVFVKQRFINPPPGQDKYLNQAGVPKQYLLYGFWQVLQLIKAIRDGTCQNKKLEENYKKYGIALTEGEFNASYLMQCGIPAVSLLGRILFQDTSKRYIMQKELLQRYGIRDLILWMDNDEPGQEAQQIIAKQLYKDFRLRQPDYGMFPDLNDANNYTLDQLDQQQFVAI